MNDTATAGHYQQLVQINQNLLAQGVTSIRLTNLAWGPITINGSTATATSYETWVTTFSDSTTMQSTDTNVYTLVQQNGSWVIQDDQQPTATPAAGQPPTSQPAPVAAVPNTQNTSHNWSGYAATGGGQTYTGVTGTWTVPQLAPNGAPGVGATWVGIGGVNSRDLIQAGTQDVASASGQSQFQAWIEMLPQPSRQVPLAVSPGDSITVSINEQGAGSGVWLIAFKDNTSGQTYQTTVHYASSQSSAEWIEEAPSGPNGIVPLDNFGSVAFSAASATVNGQTVDLSQAAAQPITMLNASSQPLAVPSAIGSDGSSFSVARTTAPATPAASTAAEVSTTPAPSAAIAAEAVIIPIPTAAPASEEAAATAKHGAQEKAGESAKQGLAQVLGGLSWSGLLRARGCLPRRGGGVLIVGVRHALGTCWAKETHAALLTKTRGGRVERSAPCATHLFVHESTSSGNNQHAA